MASARFLAGTFAVLAALLAAPGAWVDADRNLQALEAERPPGTPAAAP